MIWLVAPTHYTCWFSKHPLTMYLPYREGRINNKAHGSYTSRHHKPQRQKRRTPSCPTPTPCSACIAQSGDISNVQQVSLSFPRCSHRRGSSSQSKGQETVTGRGHGSTAKKKLDFQAKPPPKNQTDSSTQKTAGTTDRSASEQPVTYHSGRSPWSSCRQSTPGDWCCCSGSHEWRRKRLHRLWGLGLFAIFIGVGSISEFFGGGCFFSCTAAVRV